MIATIFATSARPSPLPDGLDVTNGSNRCGRMSSRDARPIVADRDHQGQVHPLRRPGDGQTDAMAVRGGERDLAAPCPSPRGDGLGGVLHQVQQHLDQLVAVGPDRRQRRVVRLAEPQVRREPGLRQAPHMLQHPVDVDRAALDRLLAEHLHAVDQRADAVRLVADQHGELPVGLAHAALQQLRGAADAGERVLHLVRQHRRHAADRSGGDAEHGLAVQRPGGRGVLQREQHAARLLVQWRGLHGDRLLVQSRALQCQIVVGDGDPVLAHLRDQREQRVVARAADRPGACGRAAASTARGTAPPHGWRSGTGSPGPAARPALAGRPASPRHRPRPSVPGPACHDPQAGSCDAPVMRPAPRALACAGRRTRRSGGARTRHRRSA